MVARRALPHALEAAIVPAILYVLASQVAGPCVAIFAPLAWAVGAVWWRAARGRKVPGMMLLALESCRDEALVERTAATRALWWPGPASIR